MTRVAGPEVFDRFLTWLEADPEAGARTYTLLHRRLVEVFSGNGCSRPEELADETLDRIIAKIDAVEDVPRTGRLFYVFGVARNVKRAYACAPRRVQRWPSPVPAEEVAEKERRDACLEQWLNTTLNAEERRLITLYYQGERREKIENRRRLAEEQDLTPLALRKKVQRLRDRLTECAENYHAEGDVERPPDRIRGL